MRNYPETIVMQQPKAQRQRTKMSQAVERNIPQEYLEHINLGMYRRQRRQNTDGVILAQVLSELMRRAPDLLAKIISETDLKAKIESAAKG